MSNNIQKNKTPQHLDLDPPASGAPQHLSLKKPQQQMVNQPFGGSYAVGQRPANPHEHPLTSPVNDPLLPEDDISTFFRNRAAVGDHESMGRFIGETSLKIVIAILIFFVVYNQHRGFQTSADVKARKWLGINLQEHIPAVGARKRPQVEKKRSANDPVALSPPLAKSIANQNSIEMAISQVRAGRWVDIEKRLTGKCQRWDATNDCLLKGFYLAHRGLKLSSRLMVSVPEVRLSKLGKPERALWYLSLAVIKENGRANHQEFDKAMALLAGPASEMRRVYFDEMIVALARARKPKEIAYFIERAKSYPWTPSWQASSTKWKALAIATVPNTMTPKAVDYMVKGERGAVRVDARSLEILAPAIIQANGAALALPVSREAVTHAISTKIDRDLVKRAIQSHIRLLVAAGITPDVASYLKLYLTQIGKDDFYILFRASSLLESPVASERSQGLTFLLSQSQNSPWELKYALAHALIRAGHAQKALPYIERLEKARMSNKGSSLWVDILRAEYRLALKQTRDSRQLEAARSRIKAGTLAAVLASPLGPLSLIR